MSKQTLKPIVFFSHSSADKRSLGSLKDLFLQKTGGSIEVLLSSDRQSIPFGSKIRTLRKSIPIVK